MPKTPKKTPAAPPAERVAMVRVAAYYRYERQGRQSGRDLDDWVAAEAEIDAMLDHVEAPPEAAQAGAAAAAPAAAAPPKAARQAATCKTAARPKAAGKPGSKKVAAAPAARATDEPPARTQRVRTAKT